MNATNNRILITTIILLSLLVFILAYFLILFRSKYIKLLATNNQKNTKRQHYQQEQQQQDENDDGHEDGIVVNTKNNRQEKQFDKKRRIKKHRIHTSLEFSEGDYDENVSELTASNNGDIEIGQPKYNSRNDEFNSAKNDVDFAKPNYITRWRNKIHKSSKNAQHFMKRFLVNNFEKEKGNKALLKNYESSGKLSPTNSINSLDEPTKENIVIPCSMIPEINRGIIRFSNSNRGSNEPLQYLTLNTSELERDNNSLVEEFRLKSVRIINSPR